MPPVSNLPYDPSLSAVPPPFGCDYYLSSRNIHIARIHYTADPDKTPAWAAVKRKQAVSDQMYMQEMEIEANAQSGAKLFPCFEEQYTVVKPFPIPHAWTRYMAIDPHPRVPHAFLWVAVSPYGDHYYYREYWPSKIYAKRGNIPEDETLYQIDDYAATIKLLESAKCNSFAPNGMADNQGQDENIRRRVMDYTAKAWMSERTKGKDGSISFWEAYRSLKIVCEECEKNMEASIDIVNTRLRPRTIMGPDGEVQRSQIQIFDTCPELILELKTNRYPQLTPHQQDTQDPTDKPMQKRRHLSDCLRYAEISNPVYVDPARPKPHSVSKVQKGVSY